MLVLDLLKAKSFPLYSCDIDDFNTLSDFVGGDKSGYMFVVTIYIMVGMTVFTTIIEIVRRQYAESWRKMQELRAQIQAQLKLADHLKKLGEAGELDEAAQAELDAIQKKLGKYKGKYGKEIGIDELEWVGGGVGICRTNHFCITD